MYLKKSRALAIAASFALAACSGADGKQGAQGPAGQPGAAGAAGDQGATGAQGLPGSKGADLTATAQPESCGVCHKDAGTEHQALYNSFQDGIDPAKSQFKASIVSVVTSAGTNANTFKSTVTFTLTKNGAPFTLAASTLKQKTMYFVSYDAASNKFPTAPYLKTLAEDPTGEIGGQDPASPLVFSYGSLTLKDAATGTWTMVKDNLSADPLAAADSFVYGYFGDTVLPIPANSNTNRHYALMDNMVSVAKVLSGTGANGTIPYASTANVKGCEKCHGAPYSKHGYRQATVAGLPDFVACKACHTDFRRGTDGGWYKLVEDPAAYAVDGFTDADKAKYIYVANIMNDTHNSHAFEFAYPQSMANCVTCHESTTTAGAMNPNVLTDANFTLTTCKSCHPVTGPATTDPKRAPALKTLLQTGTNALIHTMDLDTFTGACNTCHKAGGVAKNTFKTIHSGFNSAIYNAAGAKYAATVGMQVDTATFDSATNKLTVTFSAKNVAAGALVKPTVVASLYGYDTKDFIVSGHSSQFTDKTPNLEWTEGATIRGTTLPANTNRLAVDPATAAAGNTAWTATIDLSTWASMIADGTVKRVEFAILPSVGLDQTKAVSATNPAIAIAGAAKTFDLVAKALVADADSYGKAIVDTGKCNKCHDTLGTTFHSPNYGSAGVSTCRVCHVVTVGGSHLEMQSRSIDSYVHALHSFQVMDVAGTATTGKNFTDAVTKLEYNEHIDSEYPNFTTFNCESCHNPGTYGVPDQSKSMVGVLSASAVNTTWDRSIGSVPSVVTGPASRACGSCHRAKMINEDKAGDLAAFDAHTAAFGTRLKADAGVLDAAIAKIMAMFK